MLRRITAQRAVAPSQNTHDEHGVSRAAQQMKATAPVKREIVAAMPLPQFPGHWLLTGRTEGEFGTWHVIRKPNRTYWAAVMPNCSERQPMVVELGDKVTDPSAVLQFESGFLTFQQSLDSSHSDSSSAA